MSKFSVVIADRNPAKIQLAASQWGRAFSDSGTSDHPLLPVIGASNIAQGYNAALAQVKTEYVVFAHSDAMPITYPRYFCYQRLVERMETVDVLGFCGSDKFTGASWQASGDLYGQVMNHPPLPDKLDEGTLAAFNSGMRPGSVAIWQRPARLIRGIRVADGYCIVCRTDALRELGGFWVPESCPHFHLYDLDLFLRAFAAGMRTAIATDVYIAHQSHGSYVQPEWAGGVPEFFDRYAGVADPQIGIASVHATIHCNDTRMALVKLQEQERWMVDEITLRESPVARTIIPQVPEGE